MIEAVAEVDDAHHGEVPRRRADELTDDELVRRAPQGHASRSSSSRSLCGSAFKNKGVQLLLDAVVDYLPSPLDIPPVEGIDPDNDKPTMTRKADDDEPFAALAFKIMNDPFVGQLTFFRVYSGTLDERHDGAQLDAAASASASAASCACTPTSARRSRASRRATSARPSACATPRTGDTLCDEKHPILLEQMEFPEPVISIAIEPKTKADSRSSAWRCRSSPIEDPSFRVHTDEETGQTIITRHGRAPPRDHRRPPAREFKVEAQRRQAQVAYRETITQDGRRASTSYVKQTGGHGQYGHVRLRHRAERARQGLRLRERDRRRRHPEGVHPGDREGRPRGACDRGVLAGYPVVDVKVALFDGSYHDVDSSATGVRGRRPRWRFQDGAQARRLHLLEPIMKVEVVVPEEYMGDVIGDLNAAAAKSSA